MATAARILLWLNVIFGLFIIFATAASRGGNDIVLFGVSIQMTLSFGFLGVMAAVERLRAEIARSRQPAPVSPEHPASTTPS